MAYTHTIWPGYRPAGYFAEDNVLFIQNKIIEILGRDFTQRILIPVGDIKKIMLRVLSERLEEIPMMNQRVMMIIVSEFRNHQADVWKKLHWEKTYPHTQLLQDQTAGVSRFDIAHIKLANRLGQPRVGGTTRFYFT